MNSIKMYNHILAQEIHQQPDVFRKLIEKETSNISKITSAIRGKFDYILIAARGSSDNAARYGQYLFGLHNRIPVALATPSLFTIYEKPLNLDRSLTIGISQSGQSPDIVEVIREARRQHRPTIAVTNQTNSPLAKAADHVIALHAGDELAVAATKTYTASLLIIALISSFLQENENLVRQISIVPEKIDEILNGFHNNYTHVERYRYMQHCAVVARGMNYSTAFETSLKIKELTHIIAEPYSSADFRHGPIAMVRSGFPVIVIAPKGQVTCDLSELCQQVVERNGELIVFSDQHQLIKMAHLAIPLPDGIPEWLSPIVAIVPGQIFAYYLTLVKNLDPDQPQGIHKITETY